MANEKRREKPPQFVRPTADGIVFQRSQAMGPGDRGGFGEKVKSIGFDKQAEIEGHHAGIKGQYLIFDYDRVLNIRKHNGYRISMI